MTSPPQRGKAAKREQRSHSPTGSLGIRSGPGARGGKKFPPESASLQRNGIRDGRRPKESECWKEGSAASPARRGREIRRLPPPIRRRTAPAPKPPKQKPPSRRSCVRIPHPFRRPGKHCDRLPRKWGWSDLRKWPPVKSIKDCGRLRAKEE